MVLSQACRTIVRQFTTTSVRRSQGWQQEGIPGSNLPFDVHNKTKLTLYFILFFTSGLTAPFILLRRHLLLQYSK